MARGTNDRNLDSQTDDDVEPTQKGASGEPPAPVTLQTRLEEAWHGWLKPVGGIVLVVLAYLLYDYRLIPENLGGRLLIALILGVAIFTALEPIFQRWTDTNKRALLAGFAVLWAVGVVGPLFRVVFVPAKTLGEVHLNPGEGGGTVTQELKLPDGETGPYEIAVSGALRGSGEAEASYSLDIKGDAENPTHVEGAIKRTFLRERASRRGGTVSVRAEHEEEVHRVPGVTGAKLSISAEIGSADVLEDGLTVSVHRAWLSPVYFWVLTFLLFIFGVVVDYKLIAPKFERTYLAAAVAFTLAFAIYFPLEATPHNLVRPGVAALILSLAVGFLPGWAVSAIAGSYKPRPKKLAGAKPA